LPEQFAFDVHCTHVCVASLHVGVAPVQSTLSSDVHCTHLPMSAPAVTHAGLVVVGHASLAPEPLSPLHGLHVPASQIGAAGLPLQSEFVWHATQVLFVRLQCGVPPPQSPSPRHCTHCCTAILQRGRPGVMQFASVVQPAVHVSVSVLQMPSAPWQSGFVRHWTQRFVVALQTGSAAGHAVLFVALHCTHAFATHAGSRFDGHAAVAPEPKSPLHPTQRPEAVSQTGVVPTHALGFCAVHWTHFSVVVLQSDLRPTHRTESAAVHSTHAPVPKSHAGSVIVGHASGAPEPLLPLQATHVPPPTEVSQTGVFGFVQSFDVLHCTQISAGRLQNGLPATPTQFASPRHCTQ
jgi:hypothetical protein